MPLFLIALEAASQRTSMFYNEESLPKESVYALFGQ